MTTPFLPNAIFLDTRAPSGLLYSYIANTTTPQVTYSDAAGSVPNTNPVVLDTTGAAIVRLGAGLAYDFVLKDQTNTVTIDTLNNYVQPLYTITQAQIGAALYPQTTAESSAGVTPVNLQYPPQTVSRYGTNTVPGTTDMAAAIQMAIDSASEGSPLVSLSDENGISKPLLIKTSTAENIALQGNGRVATIIDPLAVSIATAPQNINTCIFHSNNTSSTHLHLQHLRFQSFAAGGYTGIGIYSVLGGGGDGSGQVIFSAVLYDVWVSFSTTNTGFAVGGWNNSVFDTMTFEGNKNACWALTGVGSADLHWKSISLFNCFDAFISCDANGVFVFDVNGVNSYSHNRGFLFNLLNAVQGVIEAIKLEPTLGAGNLGGIGFGSFTGCSAIVFTDFSGILRAGNAPCNTAFYLNGCTDFKLSNGQVTSDIGVQLDGAAAIDVDIANCDFSTTTTACLRITNASITGILRTRENKWNNCQLSNILDTAGINFLWESFFDEFINAGLQGGVPSTRPLNLSPTAAGVVNLYSPRIGQNNAGASGNAFVQNSGLGAVNLIRPIWVGTPPGGGAFISNTGGGTVTVEVIPAKVIVPYSASMTFNALLGTEFVITANNATAFTINAPTNPWEPMRITVRIRNTSGGALGAVTWNALFKMSAWTQPGNGFSRSIDFTYDSATGAWVQDSQTGVDVPN